MQWRVKQALRSALGLVLGAGVCAGPVGAAPRLLLNSGGPVGAVRCLAFSPDGSRLFAGGDARALQVWQFQGIGGAERPVFSHHLNWSIARGDRGAVFAAAISPRGDIAAFGGFGAYDTNGDIAVFDLGRKILHRVLDEDGHSRTIINLAFSPNGERLASASRDGEIRIWQTRDWQSRTVIAKAETDNITRVPIAFLSDDVLILAAVDASRRIQLYRVDLSQRKTQYKSLQVPHPRGVTALEKDPNSDVWVSADGDGALYVWQGDREQQPRRIDPGRMVLHAAFTTGRRLAVLRDADDTGRALLQLWDLTVPHRCIDEVAVGQSGVERILALAACPRGRAVATATGDGTILLFPLQDDDGRPRARPLSGQEPLTLEGAGRTTSKVAFDAAGGYRLGFGHGLARHGRKALNDYGNVDLVFDFGRPSRPLPPRDNDRWRSPEDGAGGWSVDWREEGAVVGLLHNGREQGRIELGQPAQGQGKVRSFCWLPGPDGTPYAIALGTDQQRGIYVYGLPVNGRCRLLRYFRDHTGWVASLSVSRDGKYLASSSGDQTIKIWSLEGLGPGANRSPLEQTWGARFEPRGGRLTVTALIEPGTAARMLNVGDSIVAVDWLEGPLRRRAQDAAAIQRRFEAGPLWHSNLLEVRRADGQDEKVLIVPGWEPLLTLFPARSGEWALWAPQGYYDASAHGDELFGWIINRGRFEQPEFFQADQFREDLERPAVIRRLLEAGSLSGAFKLAGLRPPHDPANRVVQASHTLPVLRLLEPRQNREFALNEPITIRAVMEDPAVGKADDYVVRCHVNGVPAPPPHIARQPGAATYQWEMPAVGRYNNIRVKAEHRRGGGDARYALAEVEVRAQPAAVRPTVYLMTIAADSYELRPLRFAVKDARDFRERLRQHSREIYNYGTPEIFLEEHAISQASIEGNMTSLLEKANQFNPQDLFVVFLAGHGAVRDGEFYFQTPVAKPGDSEDEYISWRQFQRLADLPCRKVVFLDSCGAGAILARDEQADEGGDAEDWTKAALRPMRRAEVFVFAAADADQTARENPTVEQGVFTFYLLRGMAGAADGATGRTRNGKVELDELVEYVKREVAQAADRMEHVQTPVSTDIRFGHIPLTRP